MKKIIGITSAAALLLVAATPALGQQQVAFKLLGGLAWMQGDDYNTGVLGAYRLAKDTSDSLTGGFGQLSGGWTLQAEIVKALRPGGHGVTVVGDDAQAIYSFRAATVENILGFPSHYAPPAQVISLEENYRSTQAILDAANALMAEAPPTMSPVQRRVAASSRVLISWM